MIEYQIIEAGSTDQLEELVRDELVAGWEPIGGATPAMLPVPVQQQFIGRVQAAVVGWYQTMIRRPE